MPNSCRLCRKGGRGKEFYHPFSEHHSWLSEHVPNAGWERRRSSLHVKRLQIMDEFPSIYSANGQWSSETFQQTDDSCSRIWFGCLLLERHPQNIRTQERIHPYTYAPGRLYSFHIDIPSECLFPTFFGTRLRLLLASSRVIVPLVCWATTQGGSQETATTENRSCSNALRTDLSLSIETHPREVRKCQRGYTAQSAKLTKTPFFTECS